MIRLYIKYWMFLAFFIGVLSQSIYAAEPPNLSAVKDQVVVYYESGEYQKDVTEVVYAAQAYLKSRILENKSLQLPKKLAVVLDLDETALSNFGSLKVLNFGCSLDILVEHAALGKDLAIAPTLNFYRYAKQQGVAIFFITGRPEAMRQITEENLRNAGFYDWSGLYMKPPDYTQKSVQPFKTQTRKNIVAEGYDIVLNMGDQESDLAGGYADRIYKIPNPFYLLY